MTVETVRTYYRWASRTDNRQAPYNDCSPNLRAINGDLSQRFGGRSLGCHVDRPVRGGTSLSTHSWGAALDWLPDGGSHEALGQVAPFLIAYSRELGINEISDYVHQLAWKPGPNHGWSRANIGSQGGQWLHIETSPAAWGDGRSVASRIGPLPPPIPPGVGYDPSKHNYGLYPLNKNKPALGPGFGYTNGTQQYQGYCRYAYDVMRVEAGQAKVLAGESPVVWTIHSMAACMNIQQFFKLPVNGWMTLETWKVIDGLASNWGKPR